MKKAGLNHPLIKIGKVVGSKGLSGHLRIHLFSGEATWIEKARSLFLAAGGQTPQPFEILQAQTGTGKDQNKLIVKLKGIPDRTAADQFKGREALISEDLLATKAGDTIYLREVMGFEVFDGDRMVGVVKGFESNVAQDLLIVDKSGSAGEVLIPLIKEFIEKIEFKNRRLLMKLPEGLTDLVIDSAKKGES